MSEVIYSASMFLTPSHSAMHVSKEQNVSIKLSVIVIVIYSYSINHIRMQSCGYRHSHILTSILYTVLGESS